MTSSMIIPVSGGFSAIVDANDFPSLSKFRWHSTKGYASRTQSKNGKSVHFSMHRQIMGESEFAVDHINGNKMDNRRANLRFCKDSENKMNCSPRRNNKTGCKGVYFNSKRGKYHASISAFGKRTFLGQFTTLNAAKLAYEKAAKEIHKNFARI